MTYDTIYNLVVKEINYYSNYNFVYFFLRFSLLIYLKYHFDVLLFRKKDFQLMYESWVIQEI